MMRSGWVVLVRKAGWQHPSDDSWQLAAVSDQVTRAQDAFEAITLDEFRWDRKQLWFFCPWRGWGHARSVDISGQSNWLCTDAAIGVHPERTHAVLAAVGHIVTGRDFIHETIAPKMEVTI